jgi:UDP-glucuronate 4-epimerase
MQRVLITGVAGFIGMHTAIRFLTEGWDVIAIDNLNDYYSVKLKNDRIKKIQDVAENLGKNFELHMLDLSSINLNSLHSFHFDAVIHLAAQAGVRYSIENPRAYINSNIIGFQNIIDFVRVSNVKKFVYASSSSVYGNDSEQPFSENAACASPQSFYAATKRTNELVANAYYHTHGVDSIGLRFFTVYGPWGRPDMAPMLFASAAFNNEPIRVFNYGNQKRDFTYIDDIVEGIFGIINISVTPKGSIILNMGNGSPVGLNDFISLIELHTKKVLNKSFIQSQPGDVDETFADITKINQFMTYQPRTSIDEGVKNFIDWYTEYYRT